MDVVTSHVIVRGAYYDVKRPPGARGLVTPMVLDRSVGRDILVLE
jgi:hypothetical protein